MTREAGAGGPTPVPDVATISMVDLLHSTLDWVGMSEIHLPARVSDTLAGERPVSTSIQAYVNLANPDAKGIHMSRLFLMLEETFGDHSVSAASIEQLLRNFLQTHEGLSTRGFVQLDFEYSMRRPALKSSYSGWKSYPVSIKGTLCEEGMRIEMYVEVPYSSTCPCSAALSRQLIQEQFRRDFAEGKVDADAVFEWLGTEEGILATPHSQRSGAQGRGTCQHKRELDHLAAEGREGAGVVEGAEVPEREHRVEQVLLRRRVHEVESEQVVDAERLEQQHLDDRPFRDVFHVGTRL